MNLFRLFFLYLRKNAIQKQRSFGNTCCEIATPIVLVGLFAWLYTMVGRNQFYAATHECDMEVLDNAMHDMVYLPNALNLTVTKLALVGAPTIRTSFLSYLNTYYPGISAADMDQLNCSIYQIENSSNNITTPIGFPGFNDYVLQFDSNSDLEKYIGNDNYGGNLDYPSVYAAIVFDNTDTDQWQYQIRVNASVVPDTHTMTNDLQQGLNLDVIHHYVAGNTSQWNTGQARNLDSRMPGFIPIQLAVDRFIMNTPGNSTDAVYTDAALFAVMWNCSNTLAPESANAVKNLENFFMSHTLLPQHARVAPFPTPEFSNDAFYGLVQSVFALIFVMTFFFPSFFLIRGLVVEKEMKLREGMRMMGMNDIALFGAWYVTYGVVFLLIATGVSIAVSRTMFSHSDGSIIFLFFWLFGMSATALCYLIHVFFSRAKLASIVGALLFISSFFPYFSVNSPLKSYNVKSAASLCSPVAFGLALDILSTLESNSAGITWVNYNDTVNNFTFGRAVGLMFFDILLYSFLGWYFGNIWPQEFGIPLKWYFPVTLEYWVPSSGEGGLLKRLLTAVGILRRSKHVDDATEALLSSEWTPAAGPNIEPPGASLADLARSNRACIVRGLRKQFDTPDGIKVAVDGVDVDMFEGQIFALLGHNGAGKTTTISMLTGLIPPSSGDATVFGASLSSDLQAVRASMGVCPQHDVLWPDLTVQEHLEFFAGLKGVPPKDVSKAVDTVIKDVGLTEKVNVFSADLSGGMKRKLSVAIALIGGSKIVFLDEPTSGMDPYSRRSTWQILQNAREGRVMILTTHFMDEADILGDRIAIMAAGRIRCCGSSMFLKKAFGVGYNLTIIKTDNCVVKNVTETLHRFVPQAELLSNVGSELSFQMPLSSSPSFPELFREFERDSSLGVRSFGVSVTTLEEVFIKVAEEAEEDHNKEQAEAADREAQLAPVGLGAKYREDMEKHPLRTFIRHWKALVIKRWHYARRDKRGVIFQLLIPVVALSAGLALLSKVSMATWPSFVLSPGVFNPHLAPVAQSPAGPVFPNFIPYASTTQADLLALAMASAGNGVNGNFPDLGAAAGVRFVPVSQSRLDVLFPPDDYPWNGTSSDCINFAYEDGLPSLAFAYEDDFSALPQAYQMSMWLINTTNGSEVLSPYPSSLDMANVNVFQSGYTLRDADLAGSTEYGASRYIAWSLNGFYQNGSTAYASYTALVNTTANHAAPVAVNLIHNGLFAMVNNNQASIKTINAPLPFTHRESLVVSSITSFISVLFVVIAFSFIPASFAMFVVKEREIGAKHQQLISGVSIVAYWTATFSWDIFNYILPGGAALALIAAFNVKELLGDAAGATALLFFLYGTAVASFTYLMSYLFKSHSTAQTMTLVINLMCLVLLLASYVMHLIPSTCYADSILRFFWRLMPGFSLGHGLMQLSMLPELPFLETDCGRIPLVEAVTRKFTPYTLDAAGWSILYLAVETAVYFLLAILVDVGLSIPILRARLFPDKDCVETVRDEDEDVIAEAERALSSRSDNDVIRVRRLRKVYGGKKTAIRSLSFALPRGECFGFLGINGAGKTTTMKVLTGDIVPTSGEATLSQYDILREQAAVRRLVGYCPQFDSHLELLSVKEHLELYARIKGVPEDVIPELVAGKLRELDLVQYSGKLAGSLSGGNKRKLSVALAMTGDPILIFLDEPSTGMDPVARRFMWRVISRISTERKQCAVMLTTHSMEEAEALCSRIGIMVGGRFRCIGSSQHLKSRFGNGYLAVFKATTPSDERLRRTLEFMKPYLTFDPSAVSNNDGSDDLMAGGWFMNASQLLPMCSALGDPTRAAMVAPDGTGFTLAQSLAANGRVEALALATWWAGESHGALLHRFVNTAFPGAELLERHGEFFNYKIPTGRPLSSLFGAIEQGKVEACIAEYSLSQLSLESIFNAMAAQQDEEKGGIRGMVKDAKNSGNNNSTDDNDVNPLLAHNPPTVVSVRSLNDGNNNGGKGLMAGLTNALKNLPGAPKFEQYARGALPNISSSGSSPGIMLEPVGPARYSRLPEDESTLTI